MSDKIDRELEKGMIQALNGLKKLRRNKEESQHKKTFRIADKNSA